MAKRLPKPLQCFKLVDFFQTDVDDFCDGHFRFRSIEEINLVMPADEDSGIESVDEKGWIVTAHLYNACRDAAGNYHGFDYTILIGGYKLKPWHNHYKAESALASANGADQLHCNDLAQFIDWCDLKGGRRCEPGYRKFVEYPETELDLQP